MRISFQLSQQPYFEGYHKPQSVIPTSAKFYAKNLALPDWALNCKKTLCAAET